MSDQKPNKFESSLILDDQQQTTTQKGTSNRFADLEHLPQTSLASAKNNSASINPSYESEIGQEQTIKNKNSLNIGDIINNRFVLVDELGRGGMGVVYKARDIRKEEARDRNPFIALKVLSDEFKSNPDSFIALQRETRKTQELAHPNIVTVYDFDKDGEHVYMTMECLDGRPLSHLLQQRYFQSCSLNERWAVIRQISSALGYAHKKNIIHLDLKPGNIYIKKDGTVKVLDFGIARAAKKADSTESIHDVTVFDAGSLGALTPPYASCEMLENNEPDFRDDIYALACVAYEVLTNQHPFNKMQATHARFNKVIPPYIKEITKKQNKALLHGLAFNRDDRVATIQQFLNETQLIGVNRPAQIKLTPGWRKMSLGFFGLILLSVFWLGFSELYIAKKYFIIPVKKSTSEISIAPSLSEVEKEKVVRMLEIAEMHFLVGRMIEPKGTNALDAYNEVLSIDPRNQLALKGVDEVANYYEKRARSFWKEGERKQSFEMLKKGLQVSPKHERLIEFQKMIGFEGS